MQIFGKNLAAAAGVKQFSSSPVMEYTKCSKSVVSGTENIGGWAYPTPQKIFVLKFCIYALNTLLE